MKKMRTTPHILLYPHITWYKMRLLFEVNYHHTAFHKLRTRP